MGFGRSENSRGPRRRMMWRVGVVTALLAALFVPASSAQAATFTVTNTNDSGPGSLRQAVIDANSTAEADTIDFSVTGTITLTSGQLEVTQDLTIDGPPTSDVTISGGDAVRVLQVAGGTTVNLNDVTVANGLGNGGGIRNFGTLTVTRVVFSGNTADASGDGGAIENNGGTLSVIRSTFSGNDGGNAGGAIFNNNSLDISRSTFSNNYANNGGAIWNSNSGSTAGVTTVTNSTFSGNTGGGLGGAIYNGDATLTLTSATFSGNSAPTGGALLATNNATTTLQNVLAANSPSGANCALFGTVNDGGGNLSWPDTSCPGINQDPLLDPAGLQDNGGPTSTIALQPGSPAIDAAVTANCPPVDQRGVSRPQGAGCDIGAFELGPMPTFEGSLTFDNVCWYSSFESDANVTVEIVDPAGPDFAPQSFPQNIGCVSSAVHGLDLLAGMQVTVTGNDSGVTKSLTLADLTFDTFDPETDTASGTGPANEGVLVEAYTLESPPLHAIGVSADAAGDWVANFGAETPSFNLTGDMGGHAEHFDNDGDTTSADIPPPPAFEASLSGNYVSGCGFSGSSVDVVVKATPTAATSLFDQAVPNEGCFFVDFWEQGFELAPDMFVSVADGLHTKELTLVNLSIDTIAPGENTLSGVAPPNETFFVDAFVESGGDVGWQGLFATSGGAGNWSVDFDDIGVDINPFTHVGTSFPDGDGDQTAFDSQFQQPGDEVVTDPGAFQDRIDDHTIIDFNELDASPVNNTWVGRTPFDGTHYTTSHGATFSNPDGDNLYIAPGGLFWNASNSLSVAQFPFDDNADDGNDDDLVIDLNPARVAVGLTIVDNGSHDEFIQFFDATNNLITQANFPDDFTTFRAFIGLVSPGQPIAKVRIVEMGFDGDDVDYDDIILVDSLQPPSFEASLSGNYVAGCGFTGSSVDVVVKASSGAAGDLFNQSVPNDGCFQVDFWDQGFELQPGMFVSVSDGVNPTKELTLVSLTIDSVDTANRTASGTAEPNTTFNVDTDVCPDGCGDYVGVEVTSDGDGNWTADFDPVLPPSGFVPGNNLGANVNDEDGDATIFDVSVPNPSFGLDVDDDTICGGGFIGPVDVTILRPDETTETFSDLPVASLDGWCLEFGDNAPEGGPFYDFQTGDIVTLKDSDGTTKELLATPIEITAIDPESDQLSGICTPATNDNVQISQDEPFEEATVPCNPDGTFDASGAIDVAYDTDVNASQFDADGDGVEWDSHTPPFPSFGLEVNDDAICGGGFIGPVDVTILRPDETTETFSDLPVASLDGWCLEFGDNAPEGGPSYDFQTGDIVTLTDSDGTTKELTLTPIEITAIDPETDQLSGICTPATNDNVQISQDGEPEEEATVPCNPGGTFDASGAIDVRRGTNVNASQSDADGDRVAWQAHLPMPTFEGNLTFDNVSGCQFDPNSSVTVVVNESPGGSELFNDSVPTDVDACFQVDLGFDLTSGMFISVHDGSLVKELTLVDLTIDAVNTSTDTVFGTAPPNTTFNVDFDTVGDGSGWVGQEVTSDGSGNWSADFGTLGFDLVVGSHVGANVGDDDGDQTAADYVVQPDEAIQGLKDDVAALVTSGELSQKQADPLITKLDTALDLLAKNKTNGAIGKLRDFKSHVNSYVRSGKLSATSGQDLIDTANGIITALGG